MNYRHYISFFFFSALAGFSCFSQSHSLNTYTVGGVDDLNTIRNIAKSKDNFIYATGTFSGTFILAGDTVNTNYYSAVYLAKFDLNLSLVWLKKIAESPSNTKIKSQIAADTSGSIIAGLSFEDTLFFYNDSAVTDTPTIELIKIDSLGNKIWANPIIGNVLGNKGITVDKGNNILVTGNLSHDLIIAKYNKDCVLLWLRTAGGTVNPDYGNVIEVDNTDNVYVSGLLYPSNSVDFDTLHITFPLGSYWASFIAKYNANGTIEWVRYVYSMTFAQYSTIAAIKCYDNGNVVAVGSYSDNLLRFSNGFSSVGAQPLNSNHSFITCFTPNGNRLWVKVPPYLGMGSDGAIEIAIDGLMLYVVNQFSLIVANQTDTLTSFGVSDISLEQYDTDGNLSSFLQIGGTSGDRVNDIIATENAIYIIGGTGSHPFNVGSDSFNSSYPVSAFIIKLLDNTTNISEPENSETILVYPNPNNGKFILQTPANKGQISITDITGKEIYRETTETGIIQIGLPNITNGIYLLRFQSDDLSDTKRIVIQN